MQHCIARDKIYIEEYIYFGTHEIWINYMLALRVHNKQLYYSFIRFSCVHMTGVCERKCACIFETISNIQITLSDIAAAEKFSNALARHLFYMLHLIMWIVCVCVRLKMYVCMHAYTHTCIGFTRAIILIHFHICTQRTNRP